MSTVAGLRGTGDWGTDERPKNFQEYILWRNPNGGTPITALLSKMRSKKTDDYEFSWWDEPVDIVRLQVAGQLAAGDTLVTVDSGDPDATNPHLVYGLAGHLKPGDLLMVEPADASSEAAVFAYEYLEVVQPISDTQFTVKRAQAGSSAGTIADDSYLLLMGNVYSQGSGEAMAASRNPIKYTNYAQIFKTVYKVTKSASLTRARTGDVLKNERKRKTMDHAKARELMYVFGRKSDTTGDNGEPKPTTEGLRRWVPQQNVTVFSSSVNADNFLDAVYKVFDFESGAGDDRMGLCGNLALNNLNKAIKAEPNARLELGNVVKMYGMNLRELILPQGRVLLRTHPLFNRHATFGSSMLLLAFSEIMRRYMRETDFEDNIQTKGEDVIKGQWLTEDGLQVEMGGLTQGYLGNINYQAG